MGYPKSTDGTPLAAPPDWVLGQLRFLRTDDGSAPMNIDGRPTGTPEVVWNGTGAGDTGGDWTRTGIGSESAAAMHSGTNGLDTGATAINDLILLDYGSMIDIASAYQSVEFWVNPQATPPGTIVRILWADGSNNPVGSVLKVNDYVTNFDLGVWQKITIPIADFVLPGNAQKLAFRFDGAAGQQYYFDDIAVTTAGGGPFVFQVKSPDPTLVGHVSMLVLVLSGSSTGWSSGTFANVAKLDNGILLRQRNLDSGEVAWSINSKDNIDLFGRYHPQDDITFADGVLLVGFMIKPGKASIKVTDKDVIEFVVRDDLSGLDNARAYAHFGVEEIGG